MPKQFESVDKGQESLESNPREIIKQALFDAFHRGTNPNLTLDQNFAELDKIADEVAKRIDELK